MRQPSIILGAIVFASHILPTASSAQFELLHELRGDLGSIRSALTLAPGGSFYGTTYDGGANSQGSIFVLRPDGAGSYLFENVHDFTGGDGANPAALLLASDGNLYGTTEHGGSDFGTLFRIDGVSGNLTTLRTFTGSDGAHPMAGLIESSNGILYGTTRVGGTGSQQGTVFQWDLSSGTFTHLHTFQGAPDGSTPVASLIEAADGNFYGTTQSGGAHGNGTVFQMEPSGSVSILHSFDGATEGGVPLGALAQGPDGFLYGTLSQGGPDNWGSVFKIDASGGITILHTFNGIDGGQPTAGLLLGADGNFYGTTRGEGSSEADIVFRISPDGDFATLHSFNGSDGARPQASLVQDADGNLYGTTSVSGDFSARGHGTVFRIDAAGDFATLHRFGDDAPAEPRAGFIEVPGSGFYGTSSLGGTAGFGAVYRMSSSGTITTVHSFEGNDGSFPVASLVRATDGNLYGVASEGGANGWGTIFRLDASGSLTVLHEFDYFGGASPRARLIQASDGHLYGTTSGGGEFFKGTVFRISLSGAFSLLHSFGGADGTSPLGLTEGSDGSLYGTAVFGGDNDLGTVFRIEPSGDVTVVHSFSGAEGSYPFTNLVRAADGEFYGTTLQGGGHGFGTVFKLETSGGLTALYSFTGGGGGSGPRAGLIQGSDGKLYGTTVSEGSGGGGTIFEIETTGALTVLHGFDFWSGSDPLGELVQASDGRLYGTTWLGGASNKGVAFRLSLGLSAPEAVASGSATICEGASTPLSGSGGVSCSWSPVHGLDDPSSCTPEASPETTTIYTLTVTDASGAISVNKPTATVTVDCPDILTVSPPILDFGQVPLGKTKDLVLTVTNGTTESVALSEGVLLEQGEPQPFDVSVAGGCRFTQFLDPGDSCTHTVRFWSVPGADAASPATLRLLDGNTFATLSTVTLVAATGPPDTGANAPPVAEDDLSGVAPGFTHTLHALRNDSDPDFDLLRIAALVDPPHGTASVVSCGSLFNPNSDCIEYVPDDGYLGVDAIVYTVSDGRGGTDSGTYHLAVGNVVPSVTSIVPSSGSVAGGQTVRITGSNFLYRSNVDFVCGGSVLPLVVTELTDAEILATTPPASAGSCDLSVRTLFAQAGLLANAYTYVAEEVRTPVLAGLVSGTLVTVNAGSEDQNDPHLDGDLVSYTNNVGARSNVHYYRFSNGVDAEISSTAGDRDFLSDVSGERVTFSRVGPDRVATMLFDVGTSLFAEIDPQSGTARFGTSVGGDTVAFVDFLQGNGDIFAWDLASSSGVNVSASADTDENPSISPDGTVLVWTRTSGQTLSDILMSRTAGGTWGPAAPVANTPDAEDSPDTDGTWVVYEAERAGERDVYLRAVAGGPELRLALSGSQSLPSINRGVVSFESTSVLPDAKSDMFVYVIAANTLYQVTDTPAIGEHLNDVRVLPNGDIRVVWAADETPTNAPEHDIHALTFTPIDLARSTTTTLSSSPNPSTFGQEVTFSATVAASAGTPTGSVTFNEGSSVLGTASLDSSGNATLTTSSLTGGPHSISAVYSGDGTHDGSTSDVLTHTVEIPPIDLVVEETITVTDAPTVTPSVMLTVPESITVTDTPQVTVIATTVTLTSAPNPSVGGEPVILTATATSPLGVPAGDVEFSYRVPGALFPRVLGTVALDASGSATLTTSELFVGSLTVTASYPGNALFPSGSAFLSHSVTPAPTTTAVASSGLLAITTRPPIFTATVGTPAPWPATGTVEFFADGVSIGQSRVFTRDGLQIAVMGGATLGVGTHSITAQYSGDASHLASAAGPLSQTVAQGDYVTVDLTPTSTEPSTATAVNNSDRVVGYIYSSFSPSGPSSTGFLYSGGGLADLGNLGGSTIFPLAINDAGQVVGAASVAAHLVPHAFLYQGGQITDLGTLGGATSRALAINNSGQIVGIADTPTESHAFLYDAGTMEDLGTLGGAESAAFSINSSGFAAGFADLADGTRHAGYYTYPWLDLGTLGGTTSRAVAINDAGQVAGTSDLAGDFDAHPFLWQGGALIDLSGVDGPSATAVAINDAGQVVGWTYLPLGGTHPEPPAPQNAFFYSSGEFTELGTLAGGTSQAADVSNSGLLVGVSDNRAFVSSGGTLRDLGTLGGSRSRAVAINDRGLIVGEADTASGVAHAVGWLPVLVPTLIVDSATGPVGGITNLTAVLTLFDLPAPNQSIEFTLNGTAVGSAVTDSLGAATVTGVSLAGFSPGSHPGAVRAAYAGSLVVGATEAFADLTVVPALVAVDDEYLTDEDAPLRVAAPGVLRNDTGAGNGEAILVASPRHGTLTFGLDGDFEYRPSANFFGSDSFTYCVSFGGVTSNAATVFLTIAPVDDAPVAADDAYQISGTSLTITAPGVLGNDADADGDSLAAVLISSPADGTLALNSDGSFAYTPGGAFAADSFQYAAIAAGRASNVATVTITRDQLVPVDGGLVSAPRVTINDNPGEQLDPHVDGDLASYTDQNGGSPEVHFYDFATQVDEAIPRLAVGDTHTLSDVNGGRISVSRQDGTNERSALVFERSTSQIVEVDPPGSMVFATAIGGDTLAFVDSEVGNDANIVLWNLGTDAEEFRTASPLFETSVAVSPDGNTAVWQRCSANFMNCDVVGAARSGGSWTVTDVTNTSAYETNPDTDGTWIVYDSDRTDSTNGPDIYLTPVAGGGEVQLALPGVQRNPSVSRGVVSFESATAAALPADLFVYVIATNTLYQVTDTPMVNETLNDVSVLPNGDIRLIWAGNDDVRGENNIYAITFSPSGSDTTPPAVGLTRPVGGERIFTGTPYVVQWTAADDVGVTAVDVAFSSDGGATFTPVPGCSGLAGATYSCTWAAPGPVTTQGRVRVAARDAAGNTASATSSANFSVVAGSASVTLTAPVAAVTWRAGNTHPIRFTHNLGVGQKVAIELSRDAGATFETINPAFVTTGASSGVFNWLVTAPATALARVRVSWSGNPSVSSASLVDFTILDRISINAPDTAVSWRTGATRNITWRHNLGTAERVNIDLSRDGGASWDAIATSVPNTTATSGTYSWVVTPPATTRARVRVSWAADPAVNSVSAVDFTISGTVSLTAPTGSASWGIGSARTVTWNHTLGAGQTFDIDLSTDDGATFPIPVARAVAAGPTSGAFDWTVPGPVSTTARLRVTWTGSAAVSRTSGAFTMVAPAITLTAPNTSVNWAIGTTRTITWSQNLGTQETVNIEESTDGGSTWFPLAANVANTANTSGSFAWSVSGPPSTAARVRVSWAKDGAVSDQSALNFTVADPFLRVTSPNTNVLWAVGSSRNLTFAHNLGIGETVLLELTRDGGATFESIATFATTSAASGSVPWTVTGPATNQARLRVTWSSNPAVTDQSNANFRIQ